MREHKND